MSSALIGCTGFVGGNLRRQAAFDVECHSTDIDRIRGQSFDLVVCAGAPAVKWKANREPDEDWRNLVRLMDVLATVQAARFALISTVDVYPVPIEVDEDSLIGEDAGEPYGRHRLALERFVRQRFTSHTVLRLPGLFGPGLRKNVIYDLLHDNQVSAISLDARFQWYPVIRLWQDLTAAISRNLDLVNLPSVPVPTRELVSDVFGDDLSRCQGTAVTRYDVRTRYAAEFGGSDGYVFSKAEIFRSLRAFVQEERGG